MARPLHNTYGEQRTTSERAGGVIVTTAEYRTMCGWWLDPNRIADTDEAVTCLNCERVFSLAMERSGGAGSLRPASMEAS